MKNNFTYRIVTGLILSLFSLGVSDINAQKTRNSNYITNQEPLLPQPYVPLPLGDIKAKGWLLNMLQTQRDGLTGRLDQMYELVLGSNNAWLGGTGDSWERGPYWLDGLTPLAYLLDDDVLKDKVKRWIDWSIENQRADGYFGPKPFEEGTIIIEGTQQKMSEDWWPKMVMLKVFQQYYLATLDQRVIVLLDKYFRYQLKELPNKSLDAYTYWAGRRGGDNLQIVYWLYNIIKEPYLLELGQLIHDQTYNWTSVLSGDEILQANPYSNLHCVNVAQGLKEPVIYFQQNPDSLYLNAPLKGLNSLKSVHGFANGMFGGDEALHGNDPTQGSEFCSAVEIMFSFESMLPITGNIYYADYLEKIAFNVLPTQHDDAFMNKQYFQQPNQIKITNEYRNFNCDYGGSGTLFGKLTGYPCCVTNMHQGWPKFTQNLFYGTADNGIAALVYAPSSATILVNKGVKVGVEEVTNYPFDDNVKFILNPEKKARFNFHLRVPEWCADPSVYINGKKQDLTIYQGIIKLERQWDKGDEISLHLPMNVITSHWFERSVAIERGPLLYALKIEEDWQEKRDDQWINGYYEVLPKSPWNYGISKKTIVGNDFKIDSREISSMPWNLQNAPLSIFTKGKVIPFWKEYNGNHGKLPESPWPNRNLETEEEVIELIPYGCTTLRISQFPVIDVHETP
ncbi:glycoside hydrolase family 127 protein [Arenibacter sp. M-2]|uniref:beta-L-arabinofuranosidase domain-containing protein n=1 Tax=Arenibacter sp. M-2 TaxID=3053612 RepID=UPI002570D887|nr:beta-L-arabinofuranosidase domain-containing protein [Arenibacter sp. M-2]MDL5512285.1 glycoside hydrolase family 127 protein [Arenibacter sp. M-2]|tara:strand:+ start:1832 stop:3871 length:2040 start_codon:yes stop_codon:yes gene_type:complete